MRINHPWLLSLISFLSAGPCTAAAPVSDSPLWNTSSPVKSRLRRQPTSANLPSHIALSSSSHASPVHIGDATSSTLIDSSSTPSVSSATVAQTTRLIFITTTTNAALIRASSASAHSNYSPWQPTSQPISHQSPRVASPSLSSGGNSTASASPRPTSDLFAQSASLSLNSLLHDANTIGTTAVISDINEHSFVASSPSLARPTGSSLFTTGTRVSHFRFKTHLPVVSTFLPFTSIPETVQHLSTGNIFAQQKNMATTTANAMDVLLSALPTNVASSLVSDYNSLVSEISIAGASTLTKSATSTTTTQTSILGASTLPHTTSPTTSATVHSIPGASTLSSTTVHSIPGASTLPSTTAPPTSSIPSTLQTASRTTSSLTSSSTTLADKQSPAMSSKQLQNASIAGIATGAAAGVVFLLLVTIFLLRRRARGQTPFRPRRSNPPSSSRGSRRIFPEVAWLYDPARTPSQHSRATEPRRDNVEMSAAGTPASPPVLPPLPQHRDMLSTPMAPAVGDEDDNADTAPLLAPAPTVARWGGPVSTEYRDTSPPPPPRSRGVSPAAGRMSRFEERSG